jgi:Flp pilus assembly protein TadD
LAPDSAGLQYRYGLALYLAGDMDQAMQRLNRAAELEPTVPDFRQARDLLKQKLDEQQ